MTDKEILKAIGARCHEAELPVPASPEAVAEAEQAIDYRLPPLLRRLYLEVANGGFDPRDGILGVLGVPGGEWIGDWADIVDVYKAFNSGPEDPHPEWLVWLFEWGCAIWSTAETPPGRCGAGTPTAVALSTASSPST
jgi:hypothetical protein